MLKALTPKQAAFVTAVTAGATYAQAYRDCYDCSRSADATVKRKAHDVAQHPQVAAQIAERRANAMDAAEVTLVGHLQDLRKLRDAAEKVQDWSAAIAAEVNRGKAAGLYVRKVEVNAPAEARVIVYLPANGR